MSDSTSDLRHGENPDQIPAQYHVNKHDRDPLALHQFLLREGAMSYNNWCDLDRLLQTYTHLAAGFLKRGSLPAISLIAKHGNCCGAAVGKLSNSSEVCLRAALGDPIAAFGGFVLTNISVKEAEVKALLWAIQGHLLDGIAMPCLTAEVLELLRRREGKCKILSNPALLADSTMIDMSERSRQVRGGRLVQPNYTHVLDFSTDVTCYGPPCSQWEYNLLLAWGIGATSNSNTITLVKEGTLIANAVGQQDRVGAATLALWKAQRAHHDVAGAVAYSDGFFPFPDAVELLIDAGVRAILAPHGSINDKKTIGLCERRGVTLYLTPYRGFFGH